MRKLVAADSAIHVAADAVQACEQLSQHLARIIGEIGVRTLLARSAALTSARFPWLAGAIPRTASADSPWAALRVAMESQDRRDQPLVHLAKLAEQVLSFGAYVLDGRDEARRRRALPG